MYFYNLAMLNIDSVIMKSWWEFYMKSLGEYIIPYNDLYIEMAVKMLGLPVYVCVAVSPLLFYCKMV